jgi:hypothetical protein
MKFSSIIIAISLAANVVLVPVLLMGIAKSPAPAPVAVDARVSTADRKAADAATAAAGLWSELRSDDPRQQVEKLRADGFPESMIRAIITAQVRASFAARRKALEAAQGERLYWRNPMPDPAAMAASRALMKEEQKAIKDVLGADPENGGVASLRRQFPAFSDDVLEQIAAISERYQEQRMEIYSSVRGPGGTLPDEQAKLDALQKAMHAEIGGVLTPQQLEDYDLRTSNTANQLRYRLAAFDATEQEFRSLYGLQSAFDEQFGMLRGNQSEEQMRARNEAQKMLDSQIAAALGPARYADYQRATDYNYQQTTQLVARLNLPPATANTLYTVQKEFEQRRNDLYRSTNNTAPAGAASQQAAALQQEATTRVATILGDPKYVEAYQQYGGSWIRSLAPRPPVRAPATKSGG